MLKKMGKMASAAVLILGLAACGGSKTAENEITFTMWGSSPAEVTAMDNTIASFEAESGIKVKKEVIDDKYMEVIKSRFAAKTSPDVLYVDAFEAPGLIQSGVLADISSEIENADDFYPQFLDAFKDSEGKTYGIPKDYSTLSLYVNTKLLTEAGYTVNDIPTDMDAFFAFTKELQSKLGEGVGALVAEKDLARHLSALEAIEPDVITKDGEANFASNPKVAEFLGKYAAGHEEKYIYEAKGDLGADWAGVAFGTEKAAMMMEGNWVLSTLEQDYPDIEYTSIELPKVNNKKQTMAFTVGYAVPKDAPNYENAVKFANYMTNQGQEQWAKESGTLPTRISVTKSMDLGADKRLESHIKGAEYATVWAKGVTLPTINTNFGDQFLATFNGQTAAKDAVVTIDEISNEEIRKQNA